MWIFCCGAQRSGSTLQYNIVKEIVELRKAGVSIEYTYSDEFPLVYSKYSKLEGYKIFKTHVLTKEMKELINSDRALAVFCFRDIRDVALSLIVKKNIPQEKFDFCTLSKRYKDGFFEIIDLPNIYKVKYEEFYNNIKFEAIKIADFIGCKLTTSEAEEIDKKLNYQAARVKIKNSDNQKFVTKSGEAIEMDMNTLLHTDHINNIYPGLWKKRLTKKSISVLEQTNYEWLTSNGYSVSIFTSIKYFFTKFLSKYH